MKKILFTGALLTSCLLANSEISTSYTYKDYENSKTKTQGKTLDCTSRFIRTASR